MANKKKITTAVVAGVTAVALVLGGTFAWTSISQQAKNESAGIVNVGGRLHDDFNGTNKDVYVENFTDPLNGGQPIYARIRLDEYMEVGSEAGKYDATTNAYVAGRNAQSVVDSATIDDVTTWTTHVPTTACTVCATSESCAIHDHWTWTMGNTEAKYYMPTFNKDKDSLDADINGTYHGLDDTDKKYYDDYVVYEKDQTVTKDAQYDNDTDTDPNTSEGQYELKNETHTAKLTGTATVVTMDYWVNTLNGAAGNYWVYDTDGWAYWANPIMPGESTGFLLDGIEMKKNPGEKCYYAINVVAQFATVSDWEYFENKDGTLGLAENSNALKVMQAASNAVPVVTVTNMSGVTTVEQGKTYDFTATVTKGATANASLTANGFEWTVYDENMVESETSTVAANADGGVTLTVGASEQSKALILAARCTDAEYLGATGLASVAVKALDKTPPTLTYEYERYPSGSSEGDAYAITTTISDVDETDYPLSISYYYLENQSSDIPEGEPNKTVTIEDSTVNSDRVALADDEENINGKFIFVKVTDAKGNIASVCSNERLVAIVGCFAAGTQVQTAEGLVAIETIQVGDEVYSIDLTTGEKVIATVSWVQETRFTDATYTIRAGAEEIITTYEHPFYVVDKEWVAAESLEVGDKLLTGDGEEVTIDEIIYTPCENQIQVYNFTVEGTHTYLIGANGFVVHNVQK